MERRRSNRVQLDRPAQVTILSPDGSRDRVVAARMLDLNQHGMRVQVDQSLAPDSPVRVDVDGRIFLGETCYCSLQQEGGFFAGIVLEQSLDNLEDLVRLTRALMGEDTRTGTRSAA